MSRSGILNPGRNLRFATLAIVLLGFVKGVPAAGLVDPTRPSYVQSDAAAHAASVRKKYRLSSILVGEQRRMAIINGQRVKEGEWVGNAKVSRINKSSVTLLIEDAAVNIALSAHDIKKQ